LESPSIHA